MFMRTVGVALAGALLLATGACAPTPEPIYAEPVFNKLGESECVPTEVPEGILDRPATFAAAPQYPSDLPPCCPEGFIVSQDLLYCVPIDQPGREPGDEPGGPGDGPIPGARN